MKRFCIVSLDNIYILPYARIYIDYILDSGHFCDLIFWDRNSASGKKDIYRNCNLKYLNWKTNASSNKFRKAIGYIKSIRFIRDNIKNNEYDGVIFLQSHAAVLLKNIVVKNYKKK